MKQLFIAATILLSLSASAQKKDTTVQLTMSIDQFRAVLGTIDQNIDSKKTSSSLLEFLQKSAQIIADKPKSETFLPHKN